MGPDYSRPDIETADRFRMSDTEGESIANLPWWKLLHDEELQRPDTHGASRKQKSPEGGSHCGGISSTRDVYRKMDFVPHSSASPPWLRLSDGRMHFSAPGFPNPFNYFMQGNLTWEIDLWGRIRRSNEAARADLIARRKTGGP